MSGFLDPDRIAAAFRRRGDALRRLRQNPATVPALRAYYAEHPAAFISDWAVTVDPRLPERGLPSVVPFELFPRQVEMVEWIMERYAASEPGVLPKSRDVGASWVTMALACALCLFRPGLHIAFGSRKAEYVDALGAPKALFPRARLLLQHLPREFLAGWTPEHFPHMRCQFPGTSSVISGEAGDNIGRGDRASIYFVDEAAFLERPHLIEASLSATTNCRIDLSSVNGMDNPFAVKVHEWPPERVFRFHWSDHPGKDAEWYRKQCELLPPVVVAQEIDLDFNASKEGVIIPPEWIQSAIGAFARLGLEASGERLASLDVADEGLDLNALAWRHGPRLEGVKSWSGKGSDIAATTARAFMLCDEAGVSRMRYDADGLGAGVRGDARGLNAARAGRPIEAVAWRASAAPVNPDRQIEQLVPAERRDRSDRTNADFFSNAKAQGWHALRLRFERTHRAVTDGQTFDPDAMIDICPDLPELRTLVAELSQPTWAPNGVGKMVVDKSPDGRRSPNLADSVMMLFAPAPRRSALLA